LEANGEIRGLAGLGPLRSAPCIRPSLYAAGAFFTLFVIVLLVVIITLL
jgi:hypothetical protein